MAQSTNQVNNELIKFKREVTYGFLRQHRFGRYMGDGATSIIRFVRDLQADGRQINIPLVDQMRGDGVGTGVLSGNEEAIDNYGYPMFADWLRHGATWTKATEKDSILKFMSIGRELLSNFAKRRVRDEIVQALLSLPTGAAPAGFRGSTGSRINGIPWALATAAQRNAWDTANSDRVLYGNAIANRVGGNVASSLANITTAMRPNTAMVELARFIAQQTTQNKITPYMIGSEDENYEEMYVLFVGSRAHRDIAADTAMSNANRDARPREGNSMQKNPIFKAGDLLWRNVIITEIPEIDEHLTLAGVGASSSNVAPMFLCGSSALGYVLGQDPVPTRADQTDYDFNRGIGIETQYGIGKIAKIPPGGTALKDWGMVTIFANSVNPT
jgi:hypothetical protein